MKMNASGLEVWKANPMLMSASAMSRGLFLPMLFVPQCTTAYFMHLGTSPFSTRHRTC